MCRSSEFIRNVYILLSYQTCFFISKVLKLETETNRRRRRRRTTSKSKKYQEAFFTITLTVSFIAMRTLNYILRKNKVGYKFTNSLEKINHLIYSIMKAYWQNRFPWFPLAIHSYQPLFLASPLDGIYWKHRADECKFLPVGQRWCVPV